MEASLGRFGCELCTESLVTAVWCLVAVLCAGGLAAAAVRLRAWNRRQAAEHDAWLQGIHDSDQEIGRLEEIRRRPSPQRERSE